MGERERDLYTVRLIYLSCISRLVSIIIGNVSAIYGSYLQMGWNHSIPIHIANHILHMLQLLLAKLFLLRLHHVHSSDHDDVGIEGLRISLELLHDTYTYTQMEMQHRDRRRQRCQTDTDTDTDTDIDRDADTDTNTGRQTYTDTNTDRNTCTYTRYYFVRSKIPSKTIKERGREQYNKRAKEETTTFDPFEPLTWDPVSHVNLVRKRSDHRTPPNSSS